jgi:hypothetical protein
MIQKESLIFFIFPSGKNIRKTKLPRLSTTSSDQKKGELGFLHSEKSNSGKEHSYLYGNRENQAEHFSQI